MGNLFKVILFHILLQGISAEVINMAPENCNDDIYGTQYQGKICFNLVKPLLNHLIRVNKQIDANDEKREYLGKLEKELDHVKMELKEQVIKTKSKEDLLMAKNDEIKDLKELIISKNEQIREQFEAQNSLLTENNKLIKNLSDLINSKNNQIGDQLKATNDLLKSKDEQISELKNAINDKDSKILEGKYQQLMKSNQQEENSSNSGHYVDSVQRIQIAGHPAFEVSYISPLSGWTVIQRRMDGSVNFNRCWKDYKNGFGDIRGEFFLGLEKIHLMTQSQPHELYIQMQDVNGTNKYARYDNFKVGSEEDNYKLISTGNYHGTAGDSLSQHVGLMFSTRDRDNDIASFNCAFAHGGWWYRKCGYSYLNGKYCQKGISPGFGIAWGSWKDWNYKISLTFTQMMIRPIQ